MSKYNRLVAAHDQSYAAADHEAHFLLGEVIKDTHILADSSATPPAGWQSVGGEVLHDPAMLQLAVQHISAAIALKPVYFYHYQRAQTYEIMGDFQAALADYAAVWNSAELEQATYRDAALLGKAKMTIALGDQEQGRELLAVYNQHQASPAQQINADEVVRRYQA